jgi:hypothetical protein
VLARVISYIYFFLSQLYLDACTRLRDFSAFLVLFEFCALKTRITAEQKIKTIQKTFIIRTYDRVADRFVRHLEKKHMNRIFLMSKVIFVL